MNTPPHRSAPMSAGTRKSDMRPTSTGPANRPPTANSTAAPAIGVGVDESEAVDVADAVAELVADPVGIDWLDGVECSDAVDRRDFSLSNELLARTEAVALPLAFAEEVIVLDNDVVAEGVLDFVDDVVAIANDDTLGDTDELSDADKLSDADELSDADALGDAGADCEAYEDEVAVAVAVALIDEVFVIVDVSEREGVLKSERVGVLESKGEGVLESERVGVSEREGEDVAL